MSSYMDLASRSRLIAALFGTSVVAGKNAIRRLARYSHRKGSCVVSDQPVIPVGGAVTTPKRLAWALRHGRLPPAGRKLRVTCPEPGCIEHIEIAPRRERDHRDPTCDTVEPHSIAKGA